MTKNKRCRRGFAGMDPEKVRQIARMGGAAVPHHLRSFSKDPELAAAAGRKGGAAGVGRSKHREKRA